ncbi:Rrf2 family transcriptional regulator [Hyphomicrobium denitrificans 1NES1]|uniref:Rrf2 family transcriptional regulator n=1 Tax=Hyphomicrobium denitrificans 1NES1 TaxID=670307 RepID=N0B5D0_9HYPH|nr:aminotransferase class V-fold PLP-dependent enzyme [Hyphomicrobium denitrificans]AGK58744.1 Rrf2 family transcriptional regulator [Hyphomicrobium denitrificans 1NES1]
MELTTKGRYAVMAMADLAAHADQAAVPLSLVAERQHLPLSYLEQLFVPLRRTGLVESARGRAGGYRLAKKSSEISIAAVMAAVEEVTHFTRCSEDDPRCSVATPCLTHGLWTALSDATSEFLASISLADVLPGGKYAARAAAVSASVSPAAVKRTYLDYNATAPLRSEAKAAMMAALDVIGNPSSVHAEGRRARGIVESARESVARLVGAKPSEVVFTSGATESNTWVMAQPWATILTSGVEHDSVLAPARAAKCNVIELSTGRDGVVRVEEIAEHILKRSIARPAVVALQMANNETGVIQPVAEVAEFARAYGIAMHSDAVQAAGRVAVDFAALGLDTMAISAHKLGGPKGVGALIIRDHLDLVPLLCGGGQERRRRAGTENVAAIAGFGAAAEAAQAELRNMSAVEALRDDLEAHIRAISPRAVIIGETASRLGNTIAVALPGKLAETLVIRLDLAGVAVSAGSACSSGKVGASHVLEAMGLGSDIASGTIRISLGLETTKDDVAAFVAAWQAIAGSHALAA